MGKKASETDRSSRRRYRILVVGPALDQKGGMASVQKLILKEMPDTFEAEHISTHDEGSLRHRGRVFGRAVLNLVGKLVQNQGDLVHLHVSKKGSVRATALPNPVEMPVRVPERSGAVPISFVFLGRIGQRKGAFDLIRAFAALPNRAEARLWLAGDGETEAAAALADELGVGAAVQLLGWIDEDRRSLLLAAAHVFVLPSYNEALPMAMLEAMAMALPTIVTPVGGIAEFVTNGDEGYLVTPGDVEAPSAAMQKLMGSAALRQAMGERGRDRIRPLDLKRYGKTLADIYLSLLENPPVEKLTHTDKATAAVENSPVSKGGASSVSLSASSAEQPQLVALRQRSGGRH